MLQFGQFHAHFSSTSKRSGWFGIGGSSATTEASANAANAVTDAAVAGEASATEATTEAAEATKTAADAVSASVADGSSAQSVADATNASASTWESIKGFLGYGNSATDAATAVTNSATDTAANVADAAANTVDAASTATSAADATSAASHFSSTLGFDPSNVANQAADAVSQAADAASQVASSLTPDQFGYLHSIGLAEGWWPSQVIEECLEIVHVFTGVPWWLSIAIVTIGFRLCLFPFFMKSSDTMAKSQLVMPQTKRLRAEINTAISRGDQRMQQIKMYEMKQLNRKYGIHYRDMFLSPVVNMAFAMGAFFGVREMSNLPVPTFETGGTLWFTDLTAADPYVGLQIISACCYAAAMGLGGETAMAQYGNKMKRIFMVLPFVSILFTWNLSAGVMVYLTANGFFSIFQSRLLRSVAFRKWAKMAPLSDKTPTNPFKAAKDEGNKQGMFDKMTNGWKDMKNNSKIKMEMQEKAVKATELQRKRARSARVIIKHRR